MVSKESIERFLSVKNIAIAGVSRDKKKFGNSSYHYLKNKGYKVFAVNPNADSIDGDPAYKMLDEIPEKIESLLVVLPPEKSKELLNSAHLLNIKNIWFQNGAESEEAVKFCREKGMDVIYDQCVLMFAAPSFPHNFHRWVTKLTGKLPH